jgi:CHASE3 domain sensor protein
MARNRTASLLSPSGFIAVGALTAILGFSAYRSSQQQFEAGTSVAHTQEVLAAIANLRADASQDPRQSQVQRDLGELHALVADNDAQVALLDALQHALAASAAAPNASAFESLRRLEQGERRLLDQRLGMQQERMRATWLAITALASVLMAALAVLWVQTRRRQ